MPVHRNQAHDVFLKLDGKVVGKVRLDKNADEALLKGDHRAFDRHLKLRAWGMPKIRVALEKYGLIETRWDRDRRTYELLSGPEAWSASDRLPRRGDRPLVVKLNGRTAGRIWIAKNLAQYPQSEVEFLLQRKSMALPAVRRIVMKEGLATTCLQGEVFEIETGRKRRDLAVKRGKAYLLRHPDITPPKPRPSVLWGKPLI